MSPGTDSGMRQYLSVAAGVLAATLAVAACADRHDEASSTAVALKVAGIDKEAGTLQTRWLIPPRASLEPPLAAPIAIDISVDRLFLLELQPPELRVYDLMGGGFLTSLGREGDGPGEYRYPVDLAVSSKGLAGVLSMNGTVTFWTPMGTLAGEARVGTGLATDLLAADGDTFYVKTDLFPPLDYAEFRVVTPDTATGEARFRDDALGGLRESGSSSRNHNYAVAATPTGDLLISPPGGEYLILRIAPNGQLRQTIRRPEVAPLSRNEEEAEAVQERVRKAFVAAGRDAPRDLHVPVYRPHISRLAVSPDGSIWALTQRGDERTAVIDHFSPSGSFTASYTAALNVGDLAVGEHSLYLLARGEYEVAGVAIAERPRATGGPTATR